VSKSFPPKKITHPSKMNFIENAKNHACPNRKDKRMVVLHKNAENRNAKKR
jgi:glycerol-3-phosphate cytidylyltransferase-like family protein